MPQPNKTKFALLGMLSTGEMSGYDIKKKFDYLHHFWSENYGHIYPILKRLEREGLVTHRSEKKEGRHDRKVYRISPEGLAAFDGWQALPDATESVRSEFLLKLFFGYRMNMAQMIQKIREEKERNLRLLEEFDSYRKLYLQMGGDETHGLYWQVSMSFGVYDARMRVQWCEDTILMLEKRKKEEK